MEAPTTSNRIHPLVAAASVSVILVSAVGVAAMAGFLPDSHSSSSPVMVATVPPPPAIEAPMAALASSAGQAETKENTQATDKDTVKRAASPSTTEKAAATRPASTTLPASRTPSYADSSRVAVKAPPVCYDCGRVESINAIQTQGEPTGVGMIAGGVIGGLIGNQIGGGNGRKVATVAGAVGGGYAGHQIEKQKRTTTTYQVRVRMEDGVVRTFAYDTQPHWATGDRVRVVEGELRSRT